VGGGKQKGDYITLLSPASQTFQLSRRAALIHVILPRKLKEARLPALQNQHTHFEEHLLNKKDRFRPEVVQV
jgi:hypothetical protein